MKAKNNNLQLPLMLKWFEMTKSGIKTEDYREMTPYWCNRLLLLGGKTISKFEWFKLMNLNIDFIQKGIINGRITFKPFSINTMTKGYPKKDNLERIVCLEHLGIEIGYGNPLWGAEPDKLYFIIKHGIIIP